MKLNRALIKEARQTNLVDYLLSKNVPLRKIGKNYTHKEHDSLFIKDNMFEWYSKNDKGNSVDFLVRHMDFDFEEAISELTNCSIDSLETKKRLASEVNTLQVSKEFSLQPINKDMRRAFAYLIKTRCIDKIIVQNLTNEKLILQDQRNDIIFPWYDENHKIVGAELNGTLTEKRFKGIESNSAYGYAYNIAIGNPTRLCIFESAIDLLSFWSIYKNKLQDVLLISMGGLKEEVIEGFLKRHTSITDIYLGVDNDEPAENFIKNVQAKIKANPMRPPKPHKDWNDYLKSQKNQGR